MPRSAPVRIFASLLLLSFGLLHLLAATSSTTYPFCTAGDVSSYTLASVNLPVQAQDMALLALMVSFAVIGVAYIVNKLFPTAGLGRWLQDEYKEVAKTAILIVVIFSIITMVSGLALALTGTTPGGDYSSNINGLVTQSELSLCNVNTYLLASMGNIAQLSLGYGVLRSLVVSWDGIPIPIPPLSPAGVTFKSGWTFQPFQNNFLQTDFNPGVDPSLFFSILTDIYFPLLNIYSVQMPLLPLLVAAGLTVLIPLGLILRAFPLVRGIGGTLLAFGLLLAVIWPSLLVLFNNPISSYFYNALNVGPGTSNASCSSLGISSTICTAIGALGIFSALPQTTTATLAPAASSSFPSINPTAYLGLISSSSGSAGQALLLPIALSTGISIYPSLNYLLSNLVFLVFQFFFVFIFDLVIAYTLTDNIAKMLGGNIRLELGGKLKLI